MTNATKTIAAVPSLAEIDAAVEAGEIPRIEGLRLTRAHHPHAHAARAVESAHRRHVASEDRKAEDAAREIEYRRRHSDEALDAVIAAGEGDLPGIYREAVILRTLETVEGRLYAKSLAQSFRNATPDAGRWSDALRSCVADARKFEANLNNPSPERSN